jgi:HEPN domain-containing protein
VTNGERADRLVREARQIAGEMSRALDDEAWNPARRRAQEALELAIKALLNEMSVVTSHRQLAAAVGDVAVR